MKPISRKRRFSILLLSPILAASFMVGFIAAITGEKYEYSRKTKKKQPIQQQAREQTYNFDMELIIPEEEKNQVTTHSQLEK
jgi:hypothetical protein